MDSASTALGTATNTAEGRPEEWRANTAPVLPTALAKPEST